MSMEITKYKDYLELFKDLIDFNEDKRKSELAQSMGCQAAFVSRVLAGQAHLSLDQLHAAAGFFGLSNKETDYWILLNLENRAVDRQLKSFFLEKLKNLRSEMNLLSEKLKIDKNQAAKNELMYYRSWLPSTLHMFSRTPMGSNIKKLAAKLNLPEKSLAPHIEQLEKLGLVTQKMNSLECQVSHMHLDATNPLVFQQHQNWRIKTLDKLNRLDDSGVHYSSVISCSEKDLGKIQDIFVDAIKKVRSLVKDSKDETVAHYSIDFYPLVDGD